MNAKKIKISEIKLNPNNPRLIKDDKFAKLVKSVKEFPEMLDIRPIVVNSDMIILGGNMRFRAAKEAGMKELPVIIANNLTEEQQKEFLIKDNVSGGEWDWDMLANEWENEQLEEWGLTINNFNTDNIDVDSFFEEDNINKEQKNKITLEYNEEEYKLVIDAFSKLPGSKESIIYKFLGL